MKRFFAHRRQFVISPRAEALHEGFVHHELAGGLVLSHCPELPVVRATTRDGRQAILLGHAVATGRDAPTPAEALAAASGEEDLAGLLWSWSGRWALLWGDRLYPDAGAMLGLYYRADGSDLTVSSSPAFFLGRGSVRQDTHEPQFGAPIVPGSGLAGVRKVLPSYSLSLADGTLRPIPVSPTQPAEGDDPIAAFAEMLGNALVDVGRRYGRVGMGLSAGYDSRVMLALAAARGVDLDCITFVKEVNILARPGAPLPSFPWRHDSEIPHRLAAAAGLPHRYVRPRPLDAAALRAFDAHTGGVFADNERYYMAHGHVAELDNPVFLKGHGTEVGKASFLRFLPWSAGRAPQDYAASLLPFLLNREGISERMLREWLDLVVASGVYAPTADLKELFGLEQKRAGWLSNVYHGSDFGYDCLALPSCRRIFRVLMAIPMAEREGCAVHRAVIARHAPELMELPFNARTRGKEKLLHLAYQVRLLNMSLPQKIKWKLMARGKSGAPA